MKIICNNLLLTNTRPTMFKPITNSQALVPRGHRSQKDPSTTPHGALFRLPPVRTAIVTGRHTDDAIITARKTNNSALRLAYSPSLQKSMLYISSAQRHCFKGKYWNVAKITNHLKPPKLTFTGKTNHPMQPAKRGKIGLYGEER